MHSSTPILSPSDRVLFESFLVRPIVFDCVDIYYRADVNAERRTLLLIAAQQLPRLPAHIVLHPDHVPTFREMLQPHQRLIPLADWQKGDTHGD